MSSMFQLQSLIIKVCDLKLNFVLISSKKNVFQQKSFYYSEKKTKKSYILIVY